MILPASCIAVLLRAFFGQHGGCNALLARLGLPVQQWLGSGWAFVILAGLFVWKNLGYNTVLLLAGLNSLPGACIEASRLDGASPPQLARRVLLPLLRPVLLFTLIVSAGNSFKCFREAWLLGGDTPHRSIYMLQHFLNNNFSNANEARLSVAAVSLFAAAAVVTGLVYARAAEERE